MSISWKEESNKNKESAETQEFSSHLAINQKIKSVCGGLQRNIQGLF
jgi:hypothetical protein